MRFVILRLCDVSAIGPKWTINVYYGNTLTFVTFPNTRAYIDKLAEKILGEIG